MSSLCPWFISIVNHQDHQGNNSKCTNNPSQEYLFYLINPNENNLQVPDSCFHSSKCCLCKLVQPFPAPSCLVHVFINLSKQFFVSIYILSLYLQFPFLLLLQLLSVPLLLLCLPLPLLLFPSLPLPLHLLLYLPQSVCLCILCLFLVDEVQELLPHLVREIEVRILHLSSGHDRCLQSDTS